MPKVIAGEGIVAREARRVAGDAAVGNGATAGRARLRIDRLRLDGAARRRLLWWLRRSRRQRFTESWAAATRTVVQRTLARIHGVIFAGRLADQPRRNEDQQLLIGILIVLRGCDQARAWDPAIPGVPPIALLRFD